MRILRVSLRRIPYIIVSLLLSSQNHPRNAWSIVRKRNRLKSFNVQNGLLGAFFNALNNKQPNISNQETSIPLYER